MADINSELTKQVIEFTEVFAELDDLVVFTPKLPVGANWGYLGPVAWKRDSDIEQHFQISVPSLSQSQYGVILLTKDGSDALGEIVDWVPNMGTIEPSRFTTWRGIPADPEKYVSGGDLFVLGMDKPTAEQTAGIKAIRKDLVIERTPDHLIWSRRLPRDTVSLNDVRIVTGVELASGAFVSTSAHAGEERTIPVIRFFS
ncbi:hypothetical protein JR316_0013422 [Psilocybe cubensis]|uniref:Uncharacterized protein n=2 Tax=Psilocybe cubensis TaxID=181762 RepID=A0A8H8CED0_PSICU|nr:uncharacterized protein JR316_0013422 [Psilocybe cubensis]KAH9474259.1 hypothetical protein JR316_0013422 [Psilocybe cubensis]